MHAYRVNVNTYMKKKDLDILEVMYENSNSSTYSYIQYIYINTDHVAYIILYFWGNDIHKHIYKYNYMKMHAHPVENIDIFAHNF